MTFHHPPRADQTLVFGDAAGRVFINEMKIKKVKESIIGIAAADSAAFTEEQKTFGDLSDTIISPITPGNVADFAARSLVLSFSMVRDQSGIFSVDFKLSGGGSCSLTLSAVAVAAMIGSFVEYFPEPG